MGGRLALSKADVTGPDGTVLKDHGVQVLGSLLRLYDGPTLAFEADGVADVVRATQKTWRVVMASGDTYQVVRGRGCSTCGGR